MLILEIIQTAATCAMPFIALYALQNWKRQDKANREAEFLDELIDSTHTFIAEISKSITVLRSVKIGIDSFIPDDPQEDKKLEGIINYIKKDGQQTYKYLSETLNATQPSRIRLESLITKGQMLGLENYKECQHAVKSLTSKFDEMEKFLILLYPNWNFEHPEVQKQLNNTLKISPDDITKHIEENNVAVIEFSLTHYKRLYS